MDLHNSFKRAMQVFFYLFFYPVFWQRVVQNSSLNIPPPAPARGAYIHLWGMYVSSSFFHSFQKGTLGVGAVHKKLKGVDLFDQSTIANICRKKEGWSVGDSEHLRQLSSHRTRTI